MTFEKYIFKIHASDFLLECSHADTLKICQKHSSSNLLSF